MMVRSWVRHHVVEGFTWRRIVFATLAYNGVRVATKKY